MDINSVNFKNFAVTTLAAGIDDTTTSISIADATKLPPAPFIAVIWNATDYPDIVSDPNVEIVYVSAVNSNTLTVIRGYDGTTASAHNSVGKVYEIANILNAGLENDIKAFINSQGVANGLATLDANGNVIQNPANATVTPTASKIPIANQYGLLADGWIGLVANVKNYGAKGDGVTDDTTAINNALSSGAAIVYFPSTSAYYKVSGSLNVKSNTTLLGGKYSFIYNDTTSAVPVISIVGTSTNRLSNITIKGLMIRNGTASTNTYTSGKDGIKIEYADNVTIEDCYITEIQGGYGLRTKYSTNISVRNNTFYRCTYSCFTVFVECENIKVENNIFDTSTGQNTANNYLFATGGENTNEGSYFCKNVWVVNNKFLNNPRWEGIDTHGCENIWIENNYVENVEIGIMIGVSLGYVSNPVLKNCYIRNNIIKQGNGGNNYYGIACKGSSNSSSYVPAENVYIENNHIVGFGSTASNTVGAITIYLVRNITINNNKIELFSGSGILLNYDVDGCIVRGNEIRNPIAADSGGNKFGIKIPGVGIWKVRILDNRIYSDNINYLFTYGIYSSSAFVHCQILGNYINNTTNKYGGYGYLPVNKSAAPTSIFGVQGDMATDTNDKITYACTDPVVRYASSVSSGITVSGTAGSNVLTITAGDYEHLCRGLEIVIAGAGSSGANLTTTILDLTNTTIYVKDNLATTVTNATVSYTDAHWVAI